MRGRLLDVADVEVMQALEKAGESLALVRMAAGDSQQTMRGTVIDKTQAADSAIHCDQLLADIAAAEQVDQCLG